MVAHSLSVHSSIDNPIFKSPHGRPGKGDICDMAARRPCRFFALGNCRNNPCAFSHDIESAAPSGTTGSVAGKPPQSQSPAAAAPSSAGVVVTAPSQVFSIDVECVAVGTRHDARAVAQFSLGALSDVSTDLSVLSSLSDSAVLISVARSFSN
jgi:hypothetical protein